MHLALATLLAFGALGADLGQPLGIAARPGGGIVVLDGKARAVVLDGRGGSSAVVFAEELGAPTGVAAVGPGRLYIADRENDAVVVVSEADGSIEAVLGRGEVQGPEDVLVTRRGEVLVADTLGGRIAWVREAGATTLEPSTPLPGGPLALAEAPDGKLAVAFTGDRVVVYDRKGDKLVPAWEATFDVWRPGALCFDGAGRLLVACEGGGTVRLYGQDGRFIRDMSARTAGGVAAPLGLACSDGRIFLLDGGNCRVLELPADLVEPRPSVTGRTPTSLTIEWATLADSEPAVTCTGPRGPEGTFPAGLGRRHVATVTGLEPDTRYTLTFPSPLNALAGDAGAASIVTCTAPREGRSQFLELDVLVPIYRAIRYGDEFPTDRFPQAPEGTTLSDDEIRKLIAAVELARLYYWTNSGMRLSLNVTYLVISEPIGLNQAGRWLPPSDQMADQLNAALRAKGDTRTARDFDIVFVYYAWRNWTDPDNRELTIGAAYGGGAYGSDPKGAGPVGRAAYCSVPACWGFHTMHHYFIHEGLHAVDSLLHESGWPEMIHADRPFTMPRAAHDGDDGDFNALILRTTPPEAWLGCAYGRIRSAYDSDGDGMPDAEPSVPLDEARFASSPTSRDTDGDGLDDLLETIAGSAVACDPRDPDTDNDNLSDSIDPLPLDATDPVLLAKTLPVPEPGVEFALDDHTLLAATDTLPGDPRGERVFMDWSAEGLTLAAEAGGSPWVTFSLDCRADGAFHGNDNYRIQLRPRGDGTVAVEFSAMPDWKQLDAAPLIARYCRAGAVSRYIVRIPPGVLNGLRLERDSVVGVSAAVMDPKWRERFLFKDRWANITLVDRAGVGDLPVEIRAYPPLASRERHVRLELRATRPLPPDAMVRAGYLTVATGDWTTRLSLGGAAWLAGGPGPLAEATLRIPAEARGDKLAASWETTYTVVDPNASDRPFLLFPTAADLATVTAEWPTNQPNPSAIVPCGARVAGKKRFFSLATALPLEDAPPAETTQAKPVSDEDYAKWIERLEWYVIGPFPNEGGTGLATSYQPESQVDLKAVYDGPAGRLRWRKVPAYAVQGNGCVDIPSIIPACGDWCVAYAYAVLTSDVEREATLLIGSDDGVAVFVNGERVHVNDVARAAWAETDRVRVRLREGKNAVLLKIANIGGGHQFRFAVLE